MSPAFLEAFCEKRMLDSCNSEENGKCGVTHVHSIASGRLLASVAFCQSLIDN